jgi:hypothetical protein
MAKVELSAFIESDIWKTAQEKYYNFLKVPLNFSEAMKSSPVKVFKKVINAAFSLGARVEFRLIGRPVLARGKNVLELCQAV